MSYGKKDEDADGAVLKVDRTAVFQEGGCKTWGFCCPFLLTRIAISSVVQLLAHLAPKMSHTSHQNRLTAVHRRVLPRERSDRSVLRNLQALPKQRSCVAADDVPSLQGARELGIRRHNDDPKHHQRHWRGWGCSLQGQCHKSLVQDNRRKQEHPSSSRGLMRRRQRQYKPLNGQ